MPAPLPIDPTPHQLAAEDFAQQLTGLLPAARLNASAVEAVLERDLFDHSGADAHFAPQAIALGYRQLVGLLRAITIAAIDLELLSEAIETEQLT